MARKTALTDALRLMRNHVRACYPCRMSRRNGMGPDERCATGQGLTNAVVREIRKRKS